MLIHRQHFYERMTGIEHLITITFETRRVYEVRVDGEFFSTAENKFRAFAEVADILRSTNWSPVRTI